MSKYDHFTSEDPHHMYSGRFFTGVPRHILDETPKQLPNPPQQQDPTAPPVPVIARHDAEIRNIIDRMVASAPATIAALPAGRKTSRRLKVIKR